MGDTIAESPDEPRIDKLFKILVRQNASDLHLKAGQPPLLRIGGNLHALKSDPLSSGQIESLIHEMLSEKQIATFDEIGSIDFARGFEGGWRVRINAFRQRGLCSLAARLVTANIPTFEDLHLPGTLRQIAEYPTGLVLVVGATGTGKSTTLAAMIQHINLNRRCHILTIEDPIEYSYNDGKAIINQRELHLDVPDWLSALKFAMREDPDVILIGEMRDPDTFYAGITAAETGHLVFGTLHASNCTQTFARILEMFPTDKHAMVRQGLSANLRAVVAQLLMPAAREGIRVVPAIEILLCNALVRNLIAKGEDTKIADVIRGGQGEGMIDMTSSIAKLVQEDMILRRDALAKAPNKERLDMALRGINVDVGKIIG